MANVLNTDKQIAIIGQLAEGSSTAGVASSQWSVGELLEAVA